MLDILERLYKIAKVNVQHYTQIFEDAIDRKINQESFSYSEEESYSYSEKNSYSGNEDWNSFGSSKGTDYYSGVPRQVVDDLSVFGLKPPSSLEEVRNARNREIKKFHPDKFMNDPEKIETSKEIMQIFNAAYDRLKEHYKNK